MCAIRVVLAAENNLNIDIDVVGSVRGEIESTKIERDDRTEK